MFGPHKSDKKRKKLPNSPEFEQKDTIQGTMSALAKDTAREASESFKDLGKGIFEQMLGMDTSQESSESPEKIQQRIIEENEKDQPVRFRPEGHTLFSFREKQEEQQIQEIKELIEAIKKEVDEIKKADASMMQQVKDIEKMTIDSMPEKVGIYHVRFLEVLLTFLRQLRMKIGESSTWLDAMKSKKAKRGSLFAARSKKAGTQYSMSQELKLTRQSQ